MVLQSSWGSTNVIVDLMVVDKSSDIPVFLDLDKNIRRGVSSIIQCVVIDELKLTI